MTQKNADKKETTGCLSAPTPYSDIESRAAAVAVTVAVARAAAAAAALVLAASSGCESRE